MARSPAARAFYARQVAIIAASAVGAGAVMGAGAVAGFTLWFGQDDGLATAVGYAISLAPFAAAGGACLGVVSLAYLLPLLLVTDLRRSLATVMGVSMPVGIGLGVVNPGIGAFAARLIQIAVAAGCAAGFRVIPKAFAWDGSCWECGYGRAGLPRGVPCPECGDLPPPGRD